MTNVMNKKPFQLETMVAVAKVPISLKGKSNFPSSLGEGRKGGLWLFITCIYITEDNYGGWVYFSVSSS